MNILGQWAKQTIYNTVMLGGSKVTDAQQAIDRIAVCKECPFAGQVEPLPGLKDQGCTICGCPFATKPFMLTHFSASKGKIVKTECPHEDGNKWKEVDKKYINK